MRYRAVVLGFLVLILMALVSGEFYYQKSEGIENISPANGSEMVLDEDSVVFEVVVDSSVYEAESFDFYVAVRDEHGEEYFVVSETDFEDSGEVVFEEEVELDEINQSINFFGEMGLRSEIHYAENEGLSTDREFTTFELVEESESSSDLQGDEENQGLLARFLNWLSSI